MRISRTAREINVEAEKLLSEKGRSNRPFFLFLNYLDAHTPYTPEPPYDTLYPGKDPTLNKPQLDQMRWDLFTRGKPMTPAATNHLVSQYDGAIAYLVHPTLLAFLSGVLWGGLIRIFVMHHATWCINSVCHIWGTRPFVSNDDSRNNVWLAYPMNPAPGNYWIVLVWFALAVTGVLVQLRITARGRT